MRYYMQFKKIFSWLAVIIWMGLIFYFSHQPAYESNGLSTGITEKILDIINGIFPKLSFDVDVIHFIIRKGAHFSVYLILGVLVILGVKNVGVKGYYMVLLSLFICVIYAISDEVHQIYIPGRSGELRDVIIDSSGAFLGIISSRFCMIRWRKRGQDSIE